MAVDGQRKSFHFIKGNFDGEAELEIYALLTQKLLKKMNYLVVHHFDSIPSTVRK